MVRALLRNGGWPVLVFGLASVSATVLWLDAAASTGAFAARGVETKALVERLRKHEYMHQSDTGNWLRNRYSVTHPYEVPSDHGTGLLQRAESNLSARAYRLLAIGEEVDVVYLPESPSRSSLRGAAERSSLLLGWQSSVLTVLTSAFANLAVLEVPKGRGPGPPSG